MSLCIMIITKWITGFAFIQMVGANGAGFFSHIFLCKFLGLREHNSLNKESMDW